VVDEFGEKRRRRMDPFVLLGVLAVIVGVVGIIVLIKGLKKRPR